MIVDDNRNILTTVRMLLEEGISSRFRQRRKVDLPQPEGPIRQTTSPR